MQQLNLCKIFRTSFLCIQIFVLIVDKSTASKDKCTTCRDIVEHFKEGLKKTEKSNFGGGNTRWEEKALGTWAHSETRLVEIWDNYLCKGDSKECHMLLEKHEEDVEEYWFQVHAKNEKVDMLQWLCISKIKVCCGPNKYGPKCTDCPGPKDRPCHGNGKCDGEGTRTGNGKCRCDAGYQGELCDECTDGYYEESKNDTHTKCNICDTSCKSTCWEEGPKGCDDCKQGYEMSENDGCMDVNECEAIPCDENQYCINTPGKYDCASCHKACKTCSQYGSDKCEECNEGYVKKDQICEDINECEEDKNLCTGEKQSCKNMPGSYECTCEEGFIYQDETKTCIPKPKDIPKPPSSSKSKDRKKKGKTERDKPGLLFLLAMILVFCVCCTIVQWNMIIVFMLSVVLGVFIYWFGEQHDAL